MYLEIITTHMKSLNKLYIKSQRNKKRNKLHKYQALIL